MFGWIWKWLFPSAEGRADLFTPAERMIYRYGVGWDARGQVVYKDEDPMVLWKRLMDRGPEISINIKVAESQSKDARTSHTALVRQIREVFNIPPPSDVFTPLDEVNCTMLLDSFMIYTGGVKKNSPAPATYSAGGPIVTPPTSAGDSATVNTSGSGSTGSDSSTGTPGLSPSASPSPLDSPTPESNTLPHSPTGTVKPSA